MYHLSLQLIHIMFLIEVIVCFRINIINEDRYLIMNLRLYKLTVRSLIIILVMMSKSIILLHFFCIFRLPIYSGVLIMHLNGRFWDTLRREI